MTTALLKFFDGDAPPEGNGERQRHWTPRRVAGMAAVAFAYFIAGKLGLRFAFVNASATAVWAPSGIAVAAVLLIGLDVLPAIFISALLINLTTAGGILSSLAIAFGNTLEAFVAGSLINQYAKGRYAFEHAGDVFRFAVLA